MKNKLILIGGGGHCKACIDVIEMEGKYEIAGIVDIQEKVGERVLGYEIIATDKELDKLCKSFSFFITVGQIKSPDTRIKLFKKIKSFDIILPTIISPLAYVSKYAKIAEGSVVMHHAIVNAGAKIGANCIINTKALLEHDAIVGDHCHISTGAIVNGGVKIGDCSFCGSGAVTKQYIEIPSNSFIPANSIIK